MVTPTPTIAYVDRLPPTADVVVIGGGIIGAATAFFARRAGLSVIVLERRPALATLTTPVATGAFRLQFDNPEEIALVREGIDLYTGFADQTGLTGYDLGLRQQGYLFCTTTEAGAARQRAWVAAQHGWGLTDVEILSGDEARYRFPHIAPEIVQARYRAADGWLDPKRLAFGYALASGATFRVDTAATALLREGERVTGVVTTAGPIAAGAVVVAAGPFAAVVANWAGLSLPIRPTRRQKLILPELPEVPPDAPMTIDEETAAHWRPALRGAHALWTDPTTAPGEPLDDVPTSARLAFGLLDPRSPAALARVSPFWRAVWQRGSDTWFLQAGQYAYTPDHRPLLGPTPAPGLFVNCGYSGHGIMASAGGSRIVVDLLTGRLSPAANPFRLDRPFPARPLDIL